MADSISQSKYQLCLQCSGLLTEHKKEDLTKFLNQFGKFKTLEYDDKAQEPRTAFIFFDSLSTMDNILAKANGKKLGKNGTIILKPKQAVWIEQIVNELQTAEKDENIEKEKLKEQINLNNKNTIKAKTIPKDGLQIKDQNSETGTLKSNEDVRLKKGVDMIERGILKEIESILHNISINNNIVKLNEKEKLKLNEQDQGLLCPTLQAVQEAVFTFIRSFTRRRTTQSTLQLSSSQSSLTLSKQQQQQQQTLPKQQVSQQNTLSKQQNTLSKQQTLTKQQQQQNQQSTLSKPNKSISPSLTISPPPQKLSPPPQKLSPPPSIDMKSNLTINLNLGSFQPNYPLSPSQTSMFQSFSSQFPLSKYNPNQSQSFAQLQVFNQSIINSSLTFLLLTKSNFLREISAFLKQISLNQITALQYTVIQNIGEGVISVAQAWQQYSNSNKSVIYQSQSQQKYEEILQLIQYKKRQTEQQVQTGQTQQQQLKQQQQQQFNTLKFKQENNYSNQAGKEIQQLLDILYQQGFVQTLVLLLNHSNVEIAEKSSLLLLTFSQVSHLQFNRKELEKTKTTDQIFQNGVINGKSDTIKVSAALILCQIYSNKINQISEYDDNLNNNKSNGEKQKNYLEKMKQEEEIKKSKIPVDQRDEIVKKLKLGQKSEILYLKGKVNEKLSELAKDKDYFSSLSKDDYINELIKNLIQSQQQKEEFDENYELEKIKKGKDEKEDLSQSQKNYLVLLAFLSDPVDSSQFIRLSIEIKLKQSQIQQLLSQQQQQQINIQINKLVEEDWRRIKVLIESIEDYEEQKQDLNLQENQEIQINNKYQLLNRINKQEDDEKLKRMKSAVIREIIKREIDLIQNIIVNEKEKAKVEEKRSFLLNFIFYNIINRVSDFALYEIFRDDILQWIKGQYEQQSSNDTNKEKIYQKSASDVILGLSERGSCDASFEYQYKISSDNQSYKPKTLKEKKKWQEIVLKKDLDEKQLDDDEQNNNQINSNNISDQKHIELRVHSETNRFFNIFQRLGISSIINSEVQSYCYMINQQRDSQKEREMNDGTLKFLELKDLKIKDQGSAGKEKDKEKQNKNALLSPKLVKQPPSHSPKLVSVKQQQKQGSLLQPQQQSQNSSPVSPKIKSLNQQQLPANLQQQISQQYQNQYPSQSTQQFEHDYTNEKGKMKQLQSALIYMFLFKNQDQSKQTFIPISLLFQDAIKFFTEKLRFISVVVSQVQLQIQQIQQQAQQPMTMAQRQQFQQQQQQNQQQIQNLKKQMNLNSEQIQDIIILTKVLQAAYCLTEVCTKPGGDVYAVKMNSVVQPLAHINCNVVSKATTTKQGSKITVVPGQQCSSLIALPDIAVVLKLSSVSYNLLAAISIRRPVVHTILIEKCNIIEHIQSILEQEVQMIIYQRQQVKEEESDKVNEVIDWVKNQKDADAQELNDSLSSTIGSTTSFSLSTTQLSKTDTSNASSYSKSQSMESNSSHSIVAESALRLLNSLLTDSQPLVEDTINSPEIINAAIKLLNIRTKGKTSQSIPGTGTNINYLLSCSLIQTPIKLINSNSFTYTLPSPSIQTSISVLAVLIRLLQWGEMSEKQNILKKIDIGQQLSNALYSAECTRSVRVNNNSRNNNQVDNDTDDNSEINVDIEIERGNDNLREYSLVGFIFLLRYDVNENKKIYENKSKTEYPSQTPKIPSSKAKSTTPSPSKTNITAIPAPITQASLSLTPAASFNTNTNTKNQSQTKQQQDNSQVVSPNQLKRGTPSPVPKQLSVSSPNQQNQNFTSLSPNSQQINQQQQVQSPLFIKQIIDEQIEEGGAIEEIELCQFHEYKKNILKNEQQQQQQQMQDANANVAGQNAIELISAQFKPASDKNSFDYSPCIGLKLFRLSQEVLMRMIRFAQNEVDEEVVEEEEEWNELEQSD